MKTCGKCGQTKELRLFYKTEGRPMSRCMDCSRAYGNKRYQTIVKPRNIEIKRQLQGVKLYGARSSANV